MGGQEACSSWTRVADAAPDAMLAVGEDGRIVHVNRAGEQLLGCDRDTVVGRLIADLVSGANRFGAWSPAQARCRSNVVAVEAFVADAGVAPAVTTVFVRRHEAQSAGPAAAARQALELAEGLAGMGTWEVDLHSGRRTWSKNLFRLLGLKPGSGTLSHDAMLGLMHPGDRERIDALVRSAVSAPERFPRAGVALELRMLAADGDVRSMRARARIERDRMARPVRWTGSVLDVTRLLATQQQLHAHLALSETFENWSSLPESVPRLLERLGRALGYTVGSLWLPNPDRGELIRRVTWSARSESFTAAEGRLTVSRADDGALGRAWATRRPIISRDLAAHSTCALGEAALAHGLVSALAIPVLDRDEVLGVIALYSAERRGGSVRLQPTLAAVGRELGRFLATRRAELGPTRLSDRELQVLRQVAEGQGTVEAARRLGISPATVKALLRSAYVKLGVSDRAAAVARAMRLGLID